MALRQQVVEPEGVGEQRWEEDSGGVAAARSARDAHDLVQVIALHTGAGRFREVLVTGGGLVLQSRRLEHATHDAVHEPQHEKRREGVWLRRTGTGALEEGLVQ